VTTGPHQPGLDGIRGIAIALVLVSHFVPVLSGAGWIGVTVFFTLSGFLITRLLLAEISETGRVNLPAFYVRRGGRLIPELVAVVAAVTVVAALTGERNAAFNAVGATTYTADFIVAAGGLLGPLSHTWSLAVEEQFYLLWPVTILLLVGHLARPLVPVVIVAILALVWRDVMVVTGAEPGRLFGPDGQLDALMAGCGLALVATRVPAPSRLLAGVAVLVIGAAAFAQHVGGVALQAAAGIPLAIVGTVILIAAVNAGRGRALSFRPLAWLGVISYSLYLWHVPILLAMWTVFGQSLASTITAFALALLAATLSYRLARPIRLWARSATKHDRAPTSVTVAMGDRV
jgi:peptidoglycan/LPS O-acetylase OafA/YrhL